MTTEPVPHMGLSASPDIPADVVEKIQQAVLNAYTTEKGKKMLAKLNIEKFEPANNATYSGYAELLKEVFGYKLSQK